MMRMIMGFILWIFLFVEWVLAIVFEVKKEIALGDHALLWCIVVLLVLIYWKIPNERD